VRRFRLRNRLGPRHRNPAPAPGPTAGRWLCRCPGSPPLALMPAPDPVADTCPCAILQWMAISDPSRVPAGREHLDNEDRELLERFEELVAAGDLESAHDVAEELWMTATDAHRALYQGLANVLAAVCAREQGKLRGALQIAQRSREMLAPFPARALGLELDVLLESMERCVERGQAGLRLGQDR